MFYGIKEIRKTSSGYVYWRGRRIDHYAYSDQQEEEQAAHQLAAKCRHLEQIGVEVSTTTLVFFEHWFVDMVPNDPYKGLLTHLCCYAIAVHPPTNKIAFVGLHGLDPVTVFYFDGSVWHRIKGAEYGGSAYEIWGTTRMEQQEWQMHPLGDATHHIPRDRYVAWLQEHRIFFNFLNEDEGGPWCKDPICWICSRGRWTLRPGEAYPPLLKAMRSEIQVPQGEEIHLSPCKRCGQGPAIWATGLCDGCKQAEEEERTREVQILQEQMAFFERHRGADALAYDAAGALIQVMYFSPYFKNLLSSTKQASVKTESCQSPGQDRFEHAFQNGPASQMKKDQNNDEL